MKHQPLLLAWLPIAITIVGLGGLTYAAVQHSLRLGANDPQIQLAEDAAAKLASGADPSGVVPGPAVDAHASLAPFMIVFDSNGQVVASSGQINSHTPALLATCVATYPVSRPDMSLDTKSDPSFLESLLLVVPRGLEPLLPP
jgi:hypothetical protein